MSLVLYLNICGASLTDTVSKQTVKNLVHKLEIDMPVEEPKEKKKVRYLHIVADEDHVAAQFWKEKGDLKEGVNGQKINTIMPKLICLYEDVINESGDSSKKPRYALTEKHYFCEVYKGTTENEKLWMQVADYIDSIYDTEYLERVYIAGDGAAWIKAGCGVLENSRFILDKFHMMKYVNVSVTHLLDSNIQNPLVDILQPFLIGSVKSLPYITFYLFGVEHPGM